MSRFSDEIKSFALSVDILNDATYREVMGMIGHWANNHFNFNFNFNFVEILRGDFDRTRKCAILQTEWAKNSSEGILTIL